MKPIPPALAGGVFFYFGYIKTCTIYLYVWKDTEELLEATVSNIDNPSFEWKSDGTNIGNGQKLLQKFEIGEHSVLLNMTFNDQTLSAKKSIIVIDSVDGITIREYTASKNQWGFQTMFKGKIHELKG